MNMKRQLFRMFTAIMLVVTPLSCKAQDFLGTTSFVSDKTWIVGYLEWSDAVVACNCKKNDFDGGDIGNYKVDCRQNPGFGDLFSDAAIRKYKDQLCPDGWKIPTINDIETLIYALVGTDPDRDDGMYLKNQLYDFFGIGIFAGMCYPDGTLGLQGYYAWIAAHKTLPWGVEICNNYSLTRHMLMYYMDGNKWNVGAWGYPVRCVKVRYAF